MKDLHTNSLLLLAATQLVSFPDPAFTKDKGLAHFAQNLGLPDLAGKELSCDNKYIHDSGWVWS